ncbi:MAG: hypothetical protein AAFR20_10155 [Pseudomonadota bacterium]
MTKQTPPEPFADSQNMAQPELDPSKYFHYLEGSGMSDEQAEEFLRQLWEIMVQFVDIGFAGAPGCNFIEDIFNNVDNDDLDTVLSSPYNFATEDEERGT